MNNQEKLVDKPPEPNGVDGISAKSKIQEVKATGDI